jgi:hypothetical protein
MVIIYTIFNTFLSYFFTKDKEPKLLCYSCGKYGHLSTSCYAMKHLVRGKTSLLVPLKRYLL